ncbi:MAG: polysaccharide deacetylase family protein [Myxococcota bacterium]
MTLAAVTIDVDSLRFYRQIHGLSDAASRAEALERDPIYLSALPRFWELVSDLPCTLFLIGQDAAVHPTAFTPVRATGSEVASHSHAHDYRLSRRHPEDIEQDLVEAERVLTPLNGGRRPVGFRAPGYNQSPPLISALVARGYHYDSSLLPSPMYFGLRAGAIGYYGLRGQPSRSLTGDARAFTGPLHPYRMRPSEYWQAHPTGSLWEFPMSVEPRTRWPLIGTTWIAMPEGLRHRALRGLAKRKLPFVFEMHAIDLLDAAEVPAELAARQADLKIPVADKLRRLRDLVRWLREDWDVRPLRDWPKALGGDHPRSSSI